MDLTLPVIPAKRYFTIGEVGDLCGVKPHVLRYWEQEFTQLRPMKRRGNRRYYQHHEVLMIRKIRDLLYDQGFTISGARNKMQEMLHSSRGHNDDETTVFSNIDVSEPAQVILQPTSQRHHSYPLLSPTDHLFSVQQQLLEIHDLLRL